ncbi:carotenoid oxygenase family protein [Rhodococcus spongiicola]|uniref:Dioxygenase n=2 Tax=Rhodococcus spongiicola TaxID=2487352 RepID=A0A438AP99_9NOCA|nr:carotenoid oxygenase family protein [Rhodococcus spongiicola]
MLIYPNYQKRRHAVSTITEPDHRACFRSLTDEVRIDSLPVTGEIPAWLSGELIRNGPAQYEVGSRSLNHWFDGHAMLHRFGFANGVISYANRFLDTRARRAALDKGEVRLTEFATDPCRSIFGRVQTAFSPQFTDNANVNLVRLGDKCLALTETPMPVVFDPETLATLGMEKSPGHHVTAHPHADPRSGEMISYAVHFGPRTTYRLHASRDGHTYRTIAKIGVREPGYMHSFALTEHYAILAEHPLLVNPLRLALGNQSFIENYRWHADRPTRLIVIDRHTGTLRGTFEAEPCFAFHHVNAFEDGPELVVDACVYDDDEIIRSTYLDRLRTEDPRIPRGTLRRWRVHLQVGSVRSEHLADTPLELPRVNYRRVNTRPYRYTWGTSISPQGRFLDRIAKVDVVDGTTTIWEQPACFPGEPVFVAAPDAREEDDGLVLTVTLDAKHGTSFLAVLDGRTLRELARASVPHHIPAGLHGQFLGTRS